MIQMFSEDNDGNVSVTFAGMPNQTVTFGRDEDEKLILNETDGVGQVNSYIYGDDGYLYYVYLPKTTSLKYVLDSSDPNGAVNKILDDNGDEYEINVDQNTQEEYYYNISTNEIVRYPLVITGFTDSTGENVYMQDETGNYYVLQDGVFELCEGTPDDISYVVDDYGYSYVVNDDKDNYAFEKEVFSENGEPITTQNVNGSIGIQMLEQAFAVADFAKMSETEIDENLDVDDALFYIDQGDLQTVIFNKTFGDSGTLIDFSANKMYFGINKQNDGLSYYIGEPSNLTDVQTPEYIIGRLKNDLENNKIMIGVMFGKTKYNENGELVDINNNPAEDDLVGAEAYEITRGHSYSVQKITEDSVFIINPWNAGAVVEVPINDFCSYLKSISVLEVEDTSETDTLETLTGLLTD